MTLKLSKNCFDSKKTQKNSLDKGDASSPALSKGK